MDTDPREDLSAQEQLVLIGLLNGCENKEIAETMGLSPCTIKNYCNQIFHKLDARNRTHCVKRAIERGYLKVEQLERGELRVEYPG